MKFEVNIPDSEIQKCLDELAVAAVRQKVRDWQSGDKIKAAVNSAWIAKLDDAIIRAFDNSDELEKRIMVQIENKIRSRLNALQKAKA